MPPIHNVIVVGATGTLGPAIVSSLLAAKFTVSVLVRTASSTRPKFPQSVAIQTTDYTSASLSSAFQNQDALVSAVGFPGLSSQPLLIDAAASAGVQRFIPSEYGNDTLADGVIPELETMLSAKRKILEYLQTKADESEGRFSWTALATGPFLDWAIAQQRLGFDIATRSAVLYDGGDSPFTGTLFAGVGDAVARILLHPAETRNKYLRVRSLRTTQNALLACLEETMVEKWTVEHVSTADMLVRGREKLKAGDRSAFGDLLSVQFFEAGTERGVVAGEGEEGMRVLDMQEVEVNEVVRAALEWKGTTE